MMAKFLKKLILFLLIPLTFVLLSDLYLRNKDSLYKEKFEGALRNSGKIETLILGNSHANYGVDPQAFDRYAYNLANVNQSLYYDKRITLKLLDKLKNLHYVLISADYHSLSFSSQGLRDVWSFYGNGITYKNKSFLKARLSPSLFAYPPKVILSFLKRDLQNILKYKGDAVDFPVQKGVNPLDSLQQGFIGFSGSDFNSFSNAKYRSRAGVFNAKVKESEESDEIRMDLEDFIKILKERGVKPILFSPPTYEKYNRYLDSLLLQKQKRAYKKIAHKYNIPYWDFMSDKNFKEEYFYNEDHLNKVGAEKLGGMLNDSIKLL